MNLIIRHRFEEEINQFVPDLKQEFQEKIAQLTAENRQLRGKLNHLSGKLAEHLLANALRGRRKVWLTDFFPDAPPQDTPFALVLVRERVVVQREDGKNFELDVVADSDDARVLLVEVKKM